MSFDPFLTLGTVRFKRFLKKVHSQSPSVPVSLLSLLDPAWQCRHPWTKIPPKFPLPGHYDNVFPLVVTHPSTQHCLVTTQYTGLLWCNKNVVSRTQSAPDPPLPAGLLDKEPVPHPSTLQIAFMYYWSCQTVFRLLKYYLERTKVQLRLFCKDPGEAFSEQSRYWKPPWLGV